MGSTASAAAAVMGRYEQESPPSEQPLSEQSPLRASADNIELPMKGAVDWRKFGANVAVFAVLTFLLLLLLSRLGVLA